MRAHGLPVSNVTKALRNLQEADLECPKCFAMNRPGAFLVRFEQNGTATCSVCGSNFTPKER